MPAITYPRAMPSNFRFKKCFFKLNYGTTDPTRTRGGAMQAVQHCPPFWTCDIESDNYLARDFVTMQTWAESLRGSLKTFLCHDDRRPYLNNYGTGAAGEAAILALTRAGGGSFDGTFEITTIGTGGYNLQSSTTATTRAPIGLVLSEGDYIGVSQSGKYSLHRVVSAATAAGSGQFTTGQTNEIYIEPYINTNVFTASVGGGLIARVIRPLAEFFMLQDSIQGGGGRHDALAFQGISKVQ